MGFWLQHNPAELECRFAKQSKQADERRQQEAETWARFRQNLLGTPMPQPQKGPRLVWDNPVYKYDALITEKPT